MNSHPAIAAAFLLILNSRTRADAPFATFFAGPDGGSQAECRPYTLEMLRTLPLYTGGAGFTRGLRVATGDVSGDGRADIIVGSGPGDTPRIAVFDGLTKAVLANFVLTGGGYDGGVFVAAGDTTGDGRTEIIAGAGAGPQVRVFNGNGFAQIAAFDAYAANFTGGVRPAAGDVTGDGRADVVTGAGPGGGPQVKLFNGNGFAEVNSYFAFDPSYTGGVFVACSQLNGDNRADIVAGPGASATPLPIKVRDGLTWSDGVPFTSSDIAFQTYLGVGDVNGDGVRDVLVGRQRAIQVFNPVTGESIESFALGPEAEGGIPLAWGDVNGDGKGDLVTGNNTLPLVRIQTPDFAKRFTKFPLGGAFTGGFHVCCGDLNGDGIYDMVMPAGTGGGGNVKTCTGTGGDLIHDFTAFATTFPVFSAAGDVNADGRDDIIASLGQGGPSQVKVFNSNGLGVLQSFFAYDPSFTGGVNPASGDFNLDGIDDIVTAPGPGGLGQVKVFSGANLAILRNFFAESAPFTAGLNVATGDLNFDKVPEFITAPASGAPTVRVFDGVTLAPLASFFAYDSTFTGGVRVATGDVDGDSFPEIICAPGPGMRPEVRAFGFPALQRKFTFLPYPVTYTGGVSISSWTPPAPRVQMSGFQRLANGNFQFNLLCPKGRTAYADFSTDGVNWIQGATRAGTGANDLFTLTPPGGPRVLTRGRSQ